MKLTASFWCFSKLNPSFDIEHVSMFTHLRDLLGPRGHIGYSVARHLQFILDVDIKSDSHSIHF